MSNKSRKFTALFTLCAMLFSPMIQADCGSCCQESCCETECCNDDCGWGYLDCCRASSICPEVAVGIVVVAATVAIIIHNRSDSDHAHN